MPDELVITIRPTATLTTLDGVPVRLWEGVTRDGIPCRVFVHRVAVREELDRAAFDRQLAERLPPGRHVPLSLIF